MIQAVKPFSRLMLTAMFAAAVVVGPLANHGHGENDDAMRLCVRTAAETTHGCCPSDGPSAPSDDSTPNQPAPCGDTQDCNCCITIGTSVTMDASMRPSYCFVEDVVETARVTNQSPVLAEWHDALLRPPQA